MERMPDPASEVVEPLRLGSIDFVNVLPVVHCLDRALEGVPRSGLQVVPGIPERLNRLIASRDLHLSPISSVEYARHQERYHVAGDLCIASRGEVRSVIMLSRRPLEALDGRPVSICRATATSRVLMRILLERFVGVSPRYLEDGAADDLETGRAEAVLLIGDDALAARHRAPSAAVRVQDLGRLWWDATGLPMVYAIWVARSEARRHPLLPAVVSALTRSREMGSSLPSSLLDAAAARTGLARPDLVEYYRCLHFVLDDAAREGLLAFYRHAAELGLCEPCPSLRFLPPSSPVDPEDRRGLGEEGPDA